MSNVISLTHEKLQTPEMMDRVSEVREAWANVDSYDVLDQMERTAKISPENGRSRLYILEPLNGHNGDKVNKSDIDESRTAFLASPHLNGWTAHQYIRARVLQQLMWPNSRLIFQPNNSYKQVNYDLSQLPEEAQDKLVHGDISPIGEMHMRSLETVSQHYNLGVVAMSGYSLGARSVLAMAAAGSDKITVTHVNADEAPSKQGRDAKQLKKDFMKSGGMIKLHKAVKESQIPALSQVMSISGMAVDIAKFGIVSAGKDAKLMQDGMTKSIDPLLIDARAQSNGATIKVGYVEDSQIFDPESLSLNATKGIALVRYGGEGFHGHPSGDNVITHALMVRDCIERF